MGITITGNVIAASPQDVEEKPCEAGDEHRHFRIRRPTAVVQGVANSPQEFVFRLGSQDLKPAVVRESEGAFYIQVPVLPSNHA